MRSRCIGVLYVVRFFHLIVHTVYFYSSRSRMFAVGIVQNSVCYQFYSIMLSS